MREVLPRAGEAEGAEAGAGRSVGVKACMGTARLTQPRLWNRRRSQGTRQQVVWYAGATPPAEQHPRRPRAGSPPLLLEPVHALLRDDGGVGLGVGAVEGDLQGRGGAAVRRSGRVRKEDGRARVVGGPGCWGEVQ